MTRVEIPDDVMFKTVGDEAVILHLDSGIYYGLDAIGSRFWFLLEEHGDVEAAIEAIEQEYDVDGATLEHDLRDLLSQLAEKGLIRIQPAV